MTPPESSTNTNPVIGVSACLLGQLVRYDGGHKLDLNITESLGQRFRFLPLCPEVECGLPVPREMMRLEGNPEAPRLMAIESRLDRTGQMLSWCEARMATLEQEQLCGLILKKNSPSCGLSGVKVYDNETVSDSGRGLFAAALADRFPQIPMADETQLAEPHLLGNFVEQVCAISRMFAQTDPHV